MSKTLLAVSGLLFALMIPAGELAAQTEPRAIPKDFKLPGPPPTNAPSASGTNGAAPDAAGKPAPAESDKTESNASQTAASDWPCVQPRVDTITPAQVWSGPDLATAAGVERTPEMQQIVSTVAARRVPLEEAEKKLVDFVSALPEDQRKAKGTAIFADLLARMNAERDEVMRGIVRYAEKQKELAKRLRAETAKLDDQYHPNATLNEMDQAQQRMAWDMRVFEERRHSLSYVCEVPTLIEQRAFGLGRALSQAL